MFKNKKGFTLVELLVVIAIIGLLTGIVLVGVSNSKLNARTSRRISDLKMLTLALDMYYDKNNESYPNSLGGAGSWDGLYSCWGDETPDWIAGLAPDYISALPRDPRNHTVCDEQYIYRSDGVNYKLISHRPEDCIGIKGKYPNLIDPGRDCWAYGYWTPGAAGW